MSWKRIGQELPPRTRRIPDFLQAPVVALGTTSAYAENTAWRSLVPLVPGNYLRMRGEYSQSLTSCPIVPELPPRARRIRDKATQRILSRGTTSACAENTSTRPLASATARNYLRVRGEYVATASAGFVTTELPPRARRIHGDPTTTTTFGRGTTSACAENTPSSVVSSVPPGNYLRVRGEYRYDFFPDSSAWELPPRARRIHPQDFDHDNIKGTTSACAENTDKHGWGGVAGGNYLRVRGEYCWGSTACACSWELPPRARRIPHVVASSLSEAGTTSACAENTGVPPRPKSW